MQVTPGFRTTWLYRCAGQLRSCIWVASLVLLLSSLSVAQRDLGTITGTVTDSTGAVVPGATVTIAADATGESYKIPTSASGDYTRVALPTGSYTVTVEAQGFRRASRQKVDVTAGSRVGVNLALEVGDVTSAI